MVGIDEQRRRRRVNDCSVCEHPALAGTGGKEFCPMYGKHAVPSNFWGPRSYRHTLATEKFINQKRYFLDEQLEQFVRFYLEKLYNDTIYNQTVAGICLRLFGRTYHEL